jgi:hypothetical protein
MMNLQTAQRISKPNGAEDSFERKIKLSFQGFNAWSLSCSAFCKSARQLNRR